MIHINSRNGHEMLAEEEFKKRHPGLYASINAPRPYQTQGDVLKGMRQRADLSQREASKLVGVGLGEYSAMEHGRTEPTQEAFGALRKALSPSGEGEGGEG